MKEDTKTPVHIVSLEVQNFRRLTVAAIKIIPGKGMVTVTGLNDSGKTSLLKAIAGALGGGGEVHRQSLRDGAKAGLVSLLLSNGFLIERKFTEKNPKGYLKVTGPDAGRHAQAKLTGWIGDGSFDPMAFFSLDREAQRDALFSVAKDPELPQKLNDLRVLQKQNRETRTPWIVKKRELNRILENEPEGEAPEPVDTKETLQLLQVLQEKKAEHDNLKSQMRDAGTVENGSREEVEHQEDRVGRLSGELETARQDLKHSKERHQQNIKDHHELDEKYGKSIDPQTSIEKAQKLLASATEVLREREPWERHAQAATEVGEVDRVVKELAGMIAEINDREVKLLAEAGIPVPGIGFDEKGFALLNGRSLDLASGRERIEVAVAVAVAADPEIRVCLVDEANDLDLDALKALDARAKRHGFQIWVVRIGLEGAGEIVVVDGVAKTRDEE